MKKYLLFIISMLCVSIGAWGEDAVITATANNKGYVITTNGDADLAALSSSTELSGNWGVNNDPTNNSVKVVGPISQTGLNIINDMMGRNSQMYYDANKFLDLSEATFSGDITSLPAGTSTAQYPSNIKFASCTLPAGSDIPATIPTGYQYVYSPCTSGGTIRIYVTEANVTIPHFTSEQIAAASQIVVTGSAKDAFIATMSADAKEKLPFDGSMAITTTSSDNIQNKVEAYLISKGVITTGATDEQKAAALAQITSLSVAGPLTSDDLTYIQSLTNLTTLNLTGVTSFGEGVTKSSIASATSATVSYPSLLYSSANGVTTITILDAGNATVEALNAKISGNISDAKVVINGEANSTDLSNIIAKFSAWSVKTLDLSGLTTLPSPTPCLSTTNNDYTKIILPAGSTVSQSEVNWDSSHNNAPGAGELYNCCGDLKYIIVPAADGEAAKLYVSAYKSGETLSAIISDLDLNDKSYFTGNESQIEVIPLNGADEVSTWESLITTLKANATWGSKITTAAGPASVVDGCKVTINMDSAEGGDTFATLLAAAKQEVVNGGNSSICTLIVTGGISDTELAALNGTDLAGATRIDLSGATIASGSSIENITLPASLEQLVLPKGMGTAKLPDALRSKFAGASNLMYAYSPTSDAQTVDGQHVADLVWVNKPGGLDKAIINEAKLRTAVYVKVESSVALNANDVDLANNNKQTGKDTYENVSLDNTSTAAPNYAWQYIDMSGANLQNDVIVSYKAPQTTNSYRLILPDGWGPNRMSIIPSIEATNYGSGLAAVYSYTAQGFLQILEITDGSYKPGALKDNRIVRSGTKAVRVVSGEYNGKKYGRFGDENSTTNNLLAAINQAASSIEAVTLTNVTSQQDLVFTNDNLIYIQLEGVTNYYDAGLKGPVVDVTKCDNLGTLNLKNCIVKSINAENVSSLKAIDLSGTRVSGNGTPADGTTNLSGTGLTNTGFVTTKDTKFQGALNLSNTALTKFTTVAEVTGDIYLDGAPLTSVELNQVQFQNTTSVIHVRKAATDDQLTTEVDETKVLIGTLGDNSIIVPTGFVSSTRIDPYIQTAIKEQEYVAPAYVFSATDMRLHEKETGDKFVYWYTGEPQNDKVLTITMTDERRGKLDKLLGSENADITSSTDLVRFKIVGPLASNDLAALASVNAQILDLSEATLQRKSSDTYTNDVTIFENVSDINQYVKFLLLPAGMTRDNVYNGDTKVSDGIVNKKSLAGFTGLYSAISLTDYNPNNAFDFTSYNKVAGTLQPAVIAAGRGTLNGSQMIRGGRTAYYPTMSGNYNRSATISGLINAYDLSYGAKLDADGHLAFNKRYANESLDADDRTNVGTETKIQGAFSGSNGPQTLDLKAAEITGPEYINDICISYLVPTNMLKYLIIPETESVKETPSYFITHNTVKEICIPSNIEVIRTHFAPSVDHIWTTAATGDLAGTVFDNGVIESATTTGSGDSQVVTQSEPVYGYTDFTFSGQYPVGTYTFSSNLKMIESHAFANTQPHVNDVYVLAKQAPECHVDAFCTAMYVGNGGYSPTIIGGVITRDSYVNGTNWIAMLHYPRECKSPEVQRYTDPTRAYTTASNETDGKGGVLYYPNHGEFLAAYAQGTLGYLWNAWPRVYQYGMLQDSYQIGNDGWTAKHQANANTKFTENPDLIAAPNNTKWTCTSFYDVTAGGTLNQPVNLALYYNVRWDEKNLYNGGETGVLLYPEANTANTALSFKVNTNGTETDANDDTKVTTRDYRGWHQFVLNAFAANTSVPVQPVRSYITDTDWWTICLPYDLTYNEMVLFYGDKTNDTAPQLHLLSNVVRNEQTHTITLNFSSDIMQNKATKDSNGVWQVAEGTKPAGTDVVLHKGVPYLIKPTFTQENRQFDVYDENINLSDYTSLSVGRIPVSSNEYPGLYEKVKAATEINGAEFRELQEKNIYTVPALLPASDNFEYTGTETAFTDVNNQITIGTKKYVRSAAFDYTFVGSLAKAIIPPYSYYLGVKNKKSCFFYADYLKDGISAATKTKFQNTMRWNNNSCVICPNMLKGNDVIDNDQHYNLGKGSHDGKITLASGKEAAQWKIFGENVTAMLKDDVYHAANMSNAPMSMMFGMNMEGGSEATTIIRVDGVEITAPSRIYSLSGQYVGDSLEGLEKGVYIQNGKKIIVK